MSELEKKFVLPDEAANCGIPIAPTKRLDIKPSLAMLIGIFETASKSIDLMDLREKVAVASCAVALKHHFPELWQKSFAAKYSHLLTIAPEEDERLLKLSKISVTYLSRYL